MTVQELIDRLQRAIADGYASSDDRITLADDADVVIEFGRYAVIITDETEW